MCDHANKGLTLILWSQVWSHLWSQYIFKIMCDHIFAHITCDQAWHHTCDHICDHMENFLRVITLWSQCDHNIFSLGRLWAKVIESKPFFVEEDLQLGEYWSAVPEKKPWVYLVKFTVTGTGDNHSGGGGSFCWWPLQH